ncbi:MAG: acyltransferase domain-containing protein [Holophagaceae bacterium]
MSAPVLLFPGQATEQPGMSGGWEADPAWRAALEAAEARTGLPLRDLMAHGPAEALRAQRVAPIAVLAHAVGLYRAHRAAGMALPAGASGHSMGFFSALVAAGVVPLEAALDLILATEDAADARFVPGSMGMAFVIGLREGDVASALAAHPGLRLSNLNGQAQFTVSGDLPSLEAFLASVGAGALKAGLLPVRHPLHCDLMAPLLPSVQEALRSWKPRDPEFPLVSPLDGRRLDDGFEAWEEAIVSVAAPIRWPAAVRGLRSLGEAFFECGHGAQLQNLTRWADRSLIVASLQEPRSWA